MKGLGLTGWAYEGLFNKMENIGMRTSISTDLPQPMVFGIKVAIIQPIMMKKDGLHD